jgi:hypothetical protein
MEGFEEWEGSSPKPRLIQGRLYVANRFAEPGDEPAAINGVLQQLSSSGPADRRDEES